MISIIKNELKVYNLFYEKYERALELDQKNIEAIAISSFDAKNNEVDSRYVNLKYIEDQDWIFFSNYQSVKANQFISLNKISGLFYWNSIDTQIRIKAVIKKLNKQKSDEHFKNRSKKKNALAISSNQSNQIESYEKVIENYNDVLDSKSLNTRPEYWGGYVFKPYYFEFWEGHENRLNKRTAFIKKDSGWDEFNLEP